MPPDWSIVPQEFYEHYVRYYGQVDAATVMSYPIADLLEGGSGIVVFVMNLRGGIIAFLRTTSGRVYRTSPAEIETLNAKTFPWPDGLEESVAFLRSQGGGAQVAYPPLSVEEAETALLSAQKHKAWLLDPMPPDTSEDVIREEGGIW